ncbi:MAG: hypothetical protein ACR2O4_01560 [Hyphomicrobiaceae bacterium]
MPHVLALAAVGLGLFAGAVWARRKVSGLQAERERADLARRSGEARPAGDLAEDPKTGVYRPE